MRLKSQNDATALIDDAFENHPSVGSKEFGYGLCICEKYLKFQIIFMLAAILLFPLVLNLVSYFLSYLSTLIS